MKRKTEKDSIKDERRKLAESSLEEFIKLVHPRRYLGSIHKNIIQWWTSSDAKNHQLLLLPRDHMKSALIAYRCVWELTRDPSLRILYISSTSNLATKQLKFMKDILTDPIYSQYWPEMVTKEEAKREKWTEREISVDHPARRAAYIRDPSIFTAGLTTNIVGLHADICVMDDVVVYTNATTELGREKTLQQYGHLSSVESADAKEWIVGTRYHPNDLYSTLLDMELSDYDSLGNPFNTRQLFDYREWPVENVGDGTGEFIWPRTKAPDGKWYGFNAEVLAVSKELSTNATWCSSEPNIITIQTTSIQHQSNEITSNTTTKTISLAETTNGTTRENLLTLLPLLTSHSLLERNQIIQPSSSSELMEKTTTTSSKSIDSDQTHLPSTSEE
jgi:hypothetical protein